MPHHAHMYARKCHEDGGCGVEGVYSSGCRVCMCVCGGTDNSAQSWGLCLMGYLLEEAVGKLLGDHSRRRPCGFRAAIVG